MSQVDLAGLRSIAEDVVGQAKRGTVVWLSGDLGSGKTAFVKQAVQVVGARDASSPTYALIHEYQSARGKIFHVDCYRLDDPTDAIDLDFPTLAQTGYLVFVEWPERAGSHAPKPDVHLIFSHIGLPDQRRIERVV